ncbi:MAG: DUF4252 domain-containing protein [Steroidobacteraceae bacterium]
MSMPTRALACLVLCLPAMALAAGPQLRLPAFDQLQRIATDSVNVSIGPWPLGIAAAMLDGKDARDAQLQELLRGVKAIYVRSFEFASANRYSQADLDGIRAQFSASEWRPLAQIHSHRDDESVEVYVCMANEKVSGLAVVASGPRELTIVNVVGSIDPQKLAVLEDRFGLPNLAR